MEFRSGPLRPGPDRLPGGICPDGLVVRWYARDGTVIVEHRLVVGQDTVERLSILGTIDAERMAATEQDHCLVVFDGDSGRRWDADEIRRCFEAAGPL